MRPSIPRIIFQCIGVLALLWLGIFWIWLLRPWDRAWYDIPLGLACLAMAGWDLAGVIRGLQAGGQKREEDSP